MKKFFTYIYLKNYQYDHMEEAMRFLTFMGIFAVLFIINFVGHLIADYFEISGIAAATQFAFILGVLLMSVFRFPYMQGYLNKYRPDSLPKETSYRTNDWKKPYLSTLGIENLDASQDEIKKAFRRLASKYHPDHNSDKNANTYFMAIRKAYEKLKA